MTADTSAPVDFLVVGTQKGGTRALRHFLGLHPDIGLHAKVEAHFFDDEKRFAAGPPDYAAYHAGFPPARPGLRRGEVTPIYMYWEPSMQRIRDYNPSIRLIALLRNPIERAYSHWMMEINRGAETMPFHNALVAESARPKTLSRERRVHFYIDRGKYSEQIRRAWRYFDRSRLLILRSEDLAERPEPTLKRVCDFLEIGADPFRGIAPARVHKGKYVGAMEPRAMAYLKSAFESEILELERLLGWDLSAWRR